MATRSKRFITGIVSGYGSILANIVFTLTSVPLALHYLDKEHFGLWALAMQINGYLNLIDLGMSGAVSRFVADYKDDVNGGEYGSHLLTGSFVFVIQGLLIAIMGIGFSWFAPQIFGVPAQLTSDFRTLLLILSATTGASVALRSLGAPLWAFQRNDVVYGCASVGLFITLAILWFGFRSGWGVVSFAIAQIPPLIATLGVHVWICRRNHYYPAANHWGKPSMAVFKRIFHFGKDILMVTLGSQLINATQIMIISRWIGLDAAATFAVATKFYSMAMQLVNNPISASAPGLAELYIRGEHQSFVRRYWDLIALTLAASCLVATGLAAGNRSMVSVWTHGSIQWSWTNDLLLALLVVLRNINGCFVGLFGLLKNWKPVRYIYFLEGVLFVPVAIFLADRFGLIGVLIASLIAHLVVTTTLSARAAMQILGSWVLIRKGIAVSLLLIIGSATFALTAERISMGNRLILASTFAISMTSIAVIWRFVLPITIRIEIVGKIKQATRRFRKTARASV